MMYLASIPHHDFLPAPLWVITSLHLLTLTLHFAAMNFLLGGLIVVVFGRFTNGWDHPAVRRFLKVVPTLMAATVTLGVAPLLFAQLTFGRSLYAAAVVNAWPWLMVPLVVIVAYYLLYGASSGRAAAASLGRRVVPALIGLIFVSLVFSNVLSLAERPELQQSVYADCQSGLSLNPDIKTWIFRWLHMVTGAVTVGAWFFGVLGRKDEEGLAVSRRFFLIGLTLAGVTGLTYMMSRGDALSPLMKSSGIGTVMLGVCLSLGAIPLFLKGRFAWSGVLLFSSLAAMVVTRHTLRLIMLPEELHPAQLYANKVAPQWDVFAIFLASFVVAIAIMWWMVRVFFRAE